MTTTASWFHCSVKPVKRSIGRSVVASAAYRLGERFEDREYGVVHDYRRRGGVECSFTLAPEHAPGWATNPERLWNAAEASEKRRNSQVGRECELALPHSLDADAREAIVEKFARALIDRYGVAVSIGIHRPPYDGENDHAHFLMTTRQIDADGLGKKTRVLDDKKTGPQEVNWIREKAASLINEALEAAGSDERITHLSFEARGIDREGTKHLGPSAAEMERNHPGSSDRGERNRDIDRQNRSPDIVLPEQRSETLDQLVAELAALNAEIAEAEEQELNARYGTPEPDAAAVPDTRVTLPSVPEPLHSPFKPHRAVAASFDATIRPDLAGLDRRHAVVWTLPSGFDTAIHPAFIAMEQTGETWLGARLWQKAAEIYHNGKETIADLAHEVSGYWQRATGRDHHTGRQSEPLGYWQRMVTRGPDPARHIDGPER